MWPTVGRDTVLGCSQRLPLRLWLSARSLIQKCYVNNRRIQLTSFGYKNFMLPKGGSKEPPIGIKKLYLTIRGDPVDISYVEIEMKVTLTNVSERIIDQGIRRCYCVVIIISHHLCSTQLPCSMHHNHEAMDRKIIILTRICPRKKYMYFFPQKMPLKASYLL